MRSSDNRKFIFDHSVILKTRTEKQKTKKYKPFFLTSETDRTNFLKNEKKCNILKQFLYCSVDLLFAGCLLCRNKILTEIISLLL